MENDARTWQGAEFDMESGAEVKRIALARAELERKQEEETANAIAAMAEDNFKPQRQLSDDTNC